MCLKNLFLCFFLVAASPVFAQQDAATDTPVYLRFPTIPQFSLSKVPDSSTITREALKKNRTTLFMLFSPECNHCQHETEELIKNISRFKNAQVVMVSYFPWEEMTAFYSHYNLKKYPQIVMGRDAKYFFPVFFKMRNFPSTYVYDKKGNFKKAFDGAVKIEDIIAEL